VVSIRLLADAGPHLPHPPAQRVELRRHRVICQQNGVLLRLEKILRIKILYKEVMVIQRALFNFCQVSILP
jgi:hypothetical protein